MAADDLAGRVEQSDINHFHCLLHFQNHRAGVRAALTASGLVGGGCKASQKMTPYAPYPLCSIGFQLCLVIKKKKMCGANVTATEERQQRRGGPALRQNPCEGAEMRGGCREVTSPGGSYITNTATMIENTVAVCF